MARTRTRILVAALFGLAVLSGLAAWMAVRGSQLPPATMVTSATSPSRAEGKPARPTASARSFPPARMDLPADRLHERVDGAEPVLRKMGCRRLLVWRIEQPPADLEVMVFESAKGATLALARDAGKARTPGLPGDEGWTNAQCVYFRRGTAYVRMIADQPVVGDALLRIAQRVERALAAGEIRP